MKTQKRSWPRLWWWLPAFLVVLVLGDRLGGAACARMFNNSQFRFARLYNERAAADILLLGNSRGLCFNQPVLEALTGERTFNLSYNAMPVELASVLVHDYLERYPAPRLLLIDVTMADRNNAPLWRQFSMLQPVSERFTEGLQKKAPYHAAACRASHLVQYNSEVFHRSVYYYRQFDNDWLQDRVMAPSVARAVETVDPYPMKILPDQLTALNRLVETAEAHGVQVELLVAPYYPAYGQRMEDYGKWMKALQDAVDHPVRSYRMEIAEREAFADFQHLNRSGSERYMRMLLEDGVLTE